MNHCWIVVLSDFHDTATAKRTSYYLLKKTTKKHQQVICSKHSGDEDFFHMFLLLFLDLGFACFASLRQVFDLAGPWDWWMAKWSQRLTPSHPPWSWNFNAPWDVGDLFLDGLSNLEPFCSYYMLLYLLYTHMICNVCIGFMHRCRIIWVLHTLFEGSELDAPKVPWSYQMTSGMAILRTSSMQKNAARHGVDMFWLEHRHVLQ